MKTLPIKYWYIPALIISIGVIFGQSSAIRSKDSEISRKTKNIDALNSEVENFRVSVNSVINGKDSVISYQASRVSGLCYTLDEYKKYRSEDLKLIEALKVKLKNVISVSNVNVQTTQHIETPVVKTDTSTCFNYSDKFLDLAGCVIKNEAEINYKHRTELVIVPSIVNKHHFLWWSWGVKGVQMDAVSKNPNDSITYNTYYEIKK